jgi:hypothetical protein
MTVEVPITKNTAPQPGAVPLTSTGGSGGQSAYIPILGGRSMASIVVPPGGFAGFAQQTAATQAMFQRAGRKGGKRTAAKRRKTRAAPKKRAARAKVAKRTRGSKRKAHLVKGSAAAKRHMAKIRRKRR